MSTASRVTAFRLLLSDDLSIMKPSASTTMNGTVNDIDLNAVCPLSSHLNNDQPAKPKKAMLTASAKRFARTFLNFSGKRETNVLLPAIILA